MRESLHSVREQGREGRDSPRAPPRAKGVGERCEYNPLVGTKRTEQGVIAGRKEITVKNADGGVGLTCGWRKRVQADY